MKFYTGKDYPHLCKGCRRMIDQCYDLVMFGEDTDDEEAPLMMAGDLGVLCGGGHCAPDLDIEEDEERMVKK